MNKKTTNNKNKKTKETTNKTKPSIVKDTQKTAVKNSKSTKITSNSNELSNLIKIIAIVLAIFAIFYIITVLVTGEKKSETEDQQEIEFNYQEILIGNILTQPNKEYFVLITTKEDSYVAAYKSYLSTYSQKENALKYYTADLDSGFNQKYYGEESNIHATDISNSTFTGTTLLKIKDKKIVSTYETEESILNYLKTLNK